MHWTALQEWGSDGGEEVGWVKGEWCQKIRRTFCCKRLVAGKIRIYFQCWAVSGGLTGRVLEKSYLS